MVHTRGVACQNGSVPEWLSRSSGPGNKRGVIVAFSAPPVERAR